MQLLPWEGAGASLCTAPLSHSQSVFGKWNRSIHLRAAPAIGASQPEKSVPLQGRISLQAQNSTSLLRGSQHPAELGGHPLHPADKLLAALGQCSWLIKKHNKTGQGQPAPPLFRTANAAIKIWSSNKKCYYSKFLYSFVIVL